MRREVSFEEHPSSTESGPIGGLRWPVTIGAPGVGARTHGKGFVCLYCIDPHNHPLKSVSEEESGSHPQLKDRPGIRSRPLDSKPFTIALDSVRMVILSSETLLENLVFIKESARVWVAVVQVGVAFSSMFFLLSLSSS